MATRTRGTKTTTVLDPDALSAEAARMAAAAREAQARAEQAKADQATARTRAEAEFWQQRATTFYRERRPLVARAWDAFAQAVRSGSPADILKTWRAYCRARAEVTAEHAALKRAAARHGLSGIRPHLVIPHPDTLTEAVDQVQAEAERQMAEQAETRLSAEAAAVVEQAEQRWRTTGQVPRPPRPVARFQVADRPWRGRHRIRVRLGYGKDDTAVMFRNGRFDAYDEATAEAVRAVAVRNRITELALDDEEAAAE